MARRDHGRHLQQVTERLERKLQETKGLDFLRSYTFPGRTTIVVNLKGSTKASEVPDIWYQVRKNVGDIRATLPAGVVRPGFNDDFGDTFGLIYGFTHRELRDKVEDIRSRLLQVPYVSKIELLGAQDEQIFVEFSTQELASLGIDRAALIAALRAQNAVSPAGALETGQEKILLRVSGAFGSEADLLNVNFLSNGRLIRLRDIATVRRGYSDPPQPIFSRQREAGDRPRHRHARRRRHSDARPQRKKGDRRKRRQLAARHRRVARFRPAGRRENRD
jgi:multidrug efflux pump subunit AcrB